MKKPIILLLSAALLMAACGGNDTSDLGRKRQELDSLKTAYKKLAERIKETEAWITEHDSTVRRNLATITAYTLNPGTWEHYVDVHGTVRADRAATLTAMGGGRVRTVHVRAGQRVGKNDLLVTMDNDLVAEQLKQAEAAYELANTTFQKQKALWDQQIGSEIQYLQAKSNRDQALAALGTLREQQRLTNITAPFAGTVDDVMLREGDMAGPGMPVVRVVDLSGVELEADVPENYLTRVKNGDPVKVRFPSVAESFDGALDHVGQFIDPANRTFKVSVRAPKGEAYMRPNLLSDISILDERMDSALVVPSRTVLEDVDGHSYVMVLDGLKDGEARVRKVGVERLNEYRGRTHVRPSTPGALPPGVRVVEDGAKNVSDGQSVRVANP